MAYYENNEHVIEEAAEVLKTRKDNLAEAAKSLQAQVRELQKELQSLKTQMANSAADDMMKQAEKVGDVSILSVYEPEADVNALRQLGDSLKDKLGECVIALAGGKDKLIFVVMATDGAVKAGAHAGNIVREAAKTAGGGGGGRPNMAQAGGKDVSKVSEALAKAVETAKSQLA